MVQTLKDGKSSNIGVAATSKNLAQKTGSASNASKATANKESRLSNHKSIDSKQGKLTTISVTAKLAPNNK